jgi:hypothetical protein
MRRLRSCDGPIYNPQFCTKYFKDEYTFNIIAKVRHTWPHECAISIMRKHVDSILMVATLVAINAEESVMRPMVVFRGVCVWRESRDRQSVLCWCFW